MGTGTYATDERRPLHIAMVSVISVLLAACTQGAPAAAPSTAQATPTTVPSPVAAKPATTLSPTATAPATSIVKEYDAPYGVVPAAGWKWGVAEIATGAQEKTQDATRHGSAWVFYVVRGSMELGTADGKKTYRAGEAVMMPAQQDHTHRFEAQSQVLVFRPADRPFGDFHQGSRLWESESLIALTAGQSYSVRIREYTLAPGVANLTAQGDWVYVIEGTLTSRASGSATLHQAGAVLALTGGSSQVLGNEGATPVRVIAVGVHIPG